MELKITVTLGDLRSEWTAPDVSIVGEGREAELSERLKLLPTVIKHLARKAGLRPLDQAEADAVMALSEAQTRGADDAELERLLEVVHEAAVRCREGDEAAKEYREASARVRAKQAASTE